jgi:hypothetical protein
VVSMRYVSVPRGILPDVSMYPAVGKWVSHGPTVGSGVGSLGPPSAANASPGNTVG